jgi:surface protein
MSIQFSLSLSFSLSGKSLQLGISMTVFFVSQPKLMLECCSFRCDIPTELVAIIRAYYQEALDNSSIREAVECWCAVVYSHSSADEVKLVYLQRKYCLLRYGVIADWDTSQVTDMSQLFFGLKSFNDDISTWDTSNVITMKQMFESAEKFNQSLEEWNVEKVSDMSGMFYAASNFNRPLARWNMKNVTNLSNMFRNGHFFNQPLDEWNVENVKKHVQYVY